MRRAMKEFAPFRCVGLSVCLSVSRTKISPLTETNDSNLLSLPSFVPTILILQVLAIPVSSLYFLTVSLQAYVLDYSIGLGLLLVTISLLLQYAIDLLPCD